MQERDRATERQSRDMTMDEATSRRRVWQRTAVCLGSALAVGLAVAYVRFHGRASPPPADSRAPAIRIGTSSLTPLHCALGEVLARTDILSRHGLRGTFLPFTHGKDQDDACRKGLVDMTFSCEVPAMIHLDRLPRFRIVGSPGELGEIALVVPASSAVTELSPGDCRRI